jgi:hypothetical protein
MNARELPQYKEVITALTPVLYDLPGKLIAIDGRSCVGKTTLGRYLAWQFNISLVESDLFLIPNQGKLVYMNEALKHVITSRPPFVKSRTKAGLCNLRVQQRCT